MRDRIQLGRWLIERKLRNVPFHLLFKKIYPEINNKTRCNNKFDVASETKFSYDIKACISVEETDLNVVAFKKKKKKKKKALSRPLENLRIVSYRRNEEQDENTRESEDRIGVCIHHLDATPLRQKKRA